MGIFTKGLALTAFAAVLVLGLAFSGGTFAKTEIKPQDGENSPRWVKELPAEQRATAQKIMAESAPQTREIREAIDARRVKLRDLMRNEQPDKAQIITLATELGALQGKLMVVKAENRAKMIKAGIPAAAIRFKGGKYGPRMENDESFRWKCISEKMKVDLGKGRLKLNPRLTPEQRMAAQKILEENATRILKTREDIKAKRAEMEILVANDTPDMAKIEALGREIGSLQGQLLLERVDLRADFAQAGLPDKIFERPGKGKHGQGKGRRGQEPKPGMDSGN